ncbi:hypothetical protein LP417_13750 [Polaromonas sp. P1-6]|nr:hypothetical protein LP417_13750 [Polaromonas sp. P1-6]
MKEALDQVRERVRCLHYSFGDKKAYLHWMSFSFAAMGCSVRATWAREVEAFLAMLATQHKALAFMHNQALSAFGFLRRLQPKKSCLDS